MPIDTNLPIGALGASSLETTERSWPACARCSERLGYRYPVEYFGIAERTKPLVKNGAYRVTIEARCHGDTQFADIDVPPFAVAPGETAEKKMSALEAIAFRSLRFFQRSGTGLHGQPDKPKVFGG
jgi:hypothetical protein